MELPEDLASLKRPVLQKLCKKAGLKANGKNVDMIRALEDLRISGTAERSEQGSKTEEEAVNPVDPLAPPPNAEVMQTEEKNAAPLISPPSATLVEPDPVSSPPPPPQCSSPNDQPQKKQPPRKKRAKRRRAGSNSKNRSKSSSRDSTPNVNTSESPATSILPPDQESMEIETPKSDVAVTPVPAHVGLIPEEAVVEGEDHSTPPPLMMSVSRKRSRRDTFSVSPKPSKQVRLNTEGETLSPMMEPAAITAERPPFSPPSSTDRPSSTNRVRNSTYTKEPLITEEDPTPFSPPSSTDRPSSSRKRVRNATYTKPSPTISSADSTTVEPPSSSSPVAAVTVSAVKPGEVVGDSEEKSSCGGGVDTPPLEEGAPPSKRQRRSTFDLSTDADVAPTTSAGMLSASEPESGQSSESVMSEMLSLLEKRVEQRKADPSYKPAPSSTAHSRIPVKSAIVSRLDRAHKKQFSKMRSIADHQRRKERLIAETSSSRTPGHSRPTLSSSAKRTVSMVTKAPGSSKGPAIVKPVQQRRPLNPGAPKTTPFQPTVLKTQNARFNFNKTQLAEQKAAKKTETAGFKTPGKQQSINTASKSGKKFKPYTGKLTAYKQSMY